MLTNSRCASSDQLQKYLSGDMSSDTQDEIAIHLERCSSCSDRLAQLAGSDTLWREAQEMLQEYQSDLSNNGRATDGKQSSNKKLSGIDAHLTHWMGPTDDPTKIGRIGPYEVIGIIGYGGAGIVLRAHDMRLNRPVAIKALLPALAHNPMARRRFERESRAVAAIVHQNVVPIFAVDIYNDHPYIAMQYVAGRSLQQRIDKEGALSVTEIVRIATQIAHALEAAHAQGIIHRDIKPANILLESNVDRVYVTDFGLARVADDATTHSGMVTGTPQYMSPEQCHGNSVDCRSDLFSLGSVMYAMCTGHPPFRSETLMGMLRKVCDHQPRNIRDANPDIPAWLESLVFRLLSKSPDDRFASASELSHVLERELAHLNNPTTVPIPPRDWIPATIEPIPTPVAIPSPVFSNYFNKGNLMIASVILLGGLSMFLFQDDGDASASGGAPAASAESVPAPSADGWTLKDADKKHPYYESKKTETAAAASGGTLTVKLNGGHVSVKAGTGDEVTVESTEQIHAATPEAAQKLSDTLQLKVNSDKKNVEITTAIQPWHDTKEGESHYKSLELIITVPTKYALNVDTNGGHVSVMNTTGNCELLTKGGHLNCEHVQGDVILTTQGGHIEATDISGKLEAKTAGGHIKLEKIGGSANAQTKGGHLTGKQIGGNATVGSYGGHIELDSVAGNIELTSQGGNIDVKKVAGKLVANANSGNVHIEYASPIKDESNVVVGSGDVHIRLPTDAAANIQAVVNHGSFHLAPEFKSANGDQQTAIISSSSQVSSSVKTKVKIEKSKPAKSKSDKAKGDKGKAKDDDDHKEESDDKSEEASEEIAEDVDEENADESTSEVSHEVSSQIISHKINGGGPAINVQLNAGRLSIEAAP